MIRDELKRLVARHLEAENAHRMAETLATLHPECVFEDVATGEIYNGIDGAEAYYRMWWDAFQLVVVRDEQTRSYWVDDQIRITETRFSGRHVGTFMGRSATHRPIGFRFAVFITFRDGLMAGERFYYDLKGLLDQIDGINPAG